ncbi:MAG: hypothetical protein CMI12_13295 [Oceanospirillum sp.]|nr:hypothetical protein [Oceanospirillum sp.]
MPKITIDGKEYDLESLSPETRNQLVSLQVCDQKIQSTQQELAILQTARIAYANALKELLPKN